MALPQLAPAAVLGVQEWRRASLLQIASSPPSRVLLAGWLGVAILIVLAQLNVVGQAALWENGHWTLAAVAGLVAAILGARETVGREREVRAWAALGLGLWTIGQLTWDIESAFGTWHHTGSAIGIYGLLAVIPAALSLHTSVKDRMRTSEEAAVYLDALAIFFAIVTLLVVTLGRDAANLGGIAGMTMLVYPIIFLAASGAALSGTLALRTDSRSLGAYSMLVGSAIIGLAWLLWLPYALEHPPVPAGYAVNPLFSIGLLTLGVGAATWQSPASGPARYQRFTYRLRAILPIAAVALSAAVLILGDRLVDPRLMTLAKVCVAVTIGTALARQSVLLRDRGVMYEEVEAAHIRARAALAQRAAAEADQRARADLLTRVLAASEELLLADIDQSFARALAMLLPDRVRGAIARYEPDDRAFVIIASQRVVEGHRSGPVIEEEALGAPLDRLKEGRIVVHSPSERNPGVERALFARGSSRLLGDLAVSELTLPLRDRSGALLGVLHLEDEFAERIAEPTFIGMAHLVANELAIAFENARLLDQLRNQIAEMRRVQSHLIQMSKMTAIGELAAGVAHEVNNPLTGVLGYAELLLEALPDDDPRREDVATIRSEALRARSIIRALLDFARPRAPERIPTDVNAVARGTIDLMRYHVERAGVRVVEEYGDLPSVELDAGAMRQVLLNLFNNAVQAMPDGGVLSVATRQDGDSVVITVADDGVGMDERVQARIFDPFFTTRGVSSGTGLGLSVSLGLVEAHEGEIGVTSEPGHGTVFQIRLPLEAAALPEPLFRRRWPPEADTVLLPSTIRSGVG